MVSSTYLLKTPAHRGCNTRLIFKWSKTVLNFELSISQTRGLTMTKEISLPYNSHIATLGGLMDSYLSQRYWRQERRRQPHLRLELELPIPFATTIIVTLRQPPTQFVIHCDWIWITNDNSQLETIISSSIHYSYSFHCYMVSISSSDVYKSILIYIVWINYSD